MSHPLLDLSLFRWIASQTNETDREALLSLREAICDVAGSYRYAEVGSHLGGSLQPHVVDDRCVTIFSIDPRPLEQPDERWTVKYQYEGNSTNRMLALLSTIPKANIDKIRTFEACSWELSPDSISEPVDFAFIDGEHTNSAVFRDFTSVRKFLASAAILAFHDCFVTPSAFLAISRILSRERPPSPFLYFPSSKVLAVVFGSTRLEQALLNFGWRKELPLSRWDSIKTPIKRRIRSIMPLSIMRLLRRCKLRLSGN